MSVAANDERSLFPSDLKALRDYLDVYARHQDEILGATDGDTARLDDRQARQERLASALEGDWTDYVAAIRAHGEADAARGLPFRDWSRRVQARRRTLIPLVVAAYRDEPERLAAALNALHDLMDGSLTVVSEVYVEAQRRLVEEQRALAETHARSLAASEQNLRRRTAILEAVMRRMEARHPRG